MRLIWLVALLVLGCLAFGQVTKTSQGFLLRSKWAKGDVFSYSMVTTAEFNGQKMPMQGSYSVKVEKVSGGVADVVVSGSMPPMGKFESPAKVDSRGFVGEDPKLRDMGARLPEKAVPIGGTWSDKKSASDGAVSMEITTTYTLKGMEIVDGVPCAVIDFVVKSSGEATASGTGRMYYETKNGQLLKSDMQMTMRIEAQGTKIDLKSSTVIKRT